MTTPRFENTPALLYARIISENTARPSVIKSANRRLESEEKRPTSLLSGVRLPLTIAVIILLNINTRGTRNALAALHEPISYSQHMLSTAHILKTNLFIIAISFVIVNCCIDMKNLFSKKHRQKMADHITIAASTYWRQYFKCTFRPRQRRETSQPAQKPGLIETLRRAWQTATARTQPVNSAIIAEAISRQRQELRYTQQHLADASGVTIRTVQRVEKTGEGSPETLRNLCATLNIKIENTADKESQIRKIRHHLTWALGAVLISVPVTMALHYITRAIFADDSGRTQIEFMGIIYQFLALPTSIGLSFAVWHAIKAYQIATSQERIRLLNNIALLMPSIILSIATTYATFRVIPLSTGITTIIDETRSLRQMMNQKNITQSALNLATTKDEKSCIYAFQTLSSNEFWNTSAKSPPTADLIPDIQHPEKTKLHFFNNFWIHYSILTATTARHPGPLADYRDPSAFARETETCYQLSLHKSE